MSHNLGHQKRSWQSAASLLCISVYTYVHIYVFVCKDAHKTPDGSGRGSANISSRGGFVACTYQHSLPLTKKGALCGAGHGFFFQIIRQGGRAEGQQLSTRGPHALYQRQFCTHSLGGQGICGLHAKTVGSMPPSRGAGSVYDSALLGVLH